MMASRRSEHHQNCSSRGVFPVCSGQYLSKEVQGRNNGESATVAWAVHLFHLFVNINIQSANYMTATRYGSVDLLKSKKSNTTKKEGDFECHSVVGVRLGWSEYLCI